MNYVWQKWCSPLNLELVIVSLENMYGMGCICFAIWKGEMSSCLCHLFVDSLWHTTHSGLMLMQWSNYFLSLLPLWRDFLDWEDIFFFFFNYIFPTGDTHNNYQNWNVGQASQTHLLPLPRHHSYWSWCIPLGEAMSYHYFPMSFFGNWHYCVLWMKVKWMAFRIRINLFRNCMCFMDICFNHTSPSILRI